MSRGNMHIRSVIEDVVPSVAKQVHDLIRDLKNIYFSKYRGILELKLESFFEIESLPALLGNAYGPGYFWQSLRKTLNRRDLTLGRMAKAISQKLNELANKREFWLMKKELLFYFCFLYFYREYTATVQNSRKEVILLEEWQQLMESYQKGELNDSELQSPDTLGFVSGLMTRQFENSYHYKTGKSFLEHRVMKFGSKLTPLMIWEHGLLRSFELDKQWDLNLAEHFYKSIPQVTAGFNHLIQGNKDQNALIAQSEFFMNMFWAGYHMYKNPKKQ